MFRIPDNMKQFSVIYLRWMKPFAYRKMYTEDDICFSVVVNNHKFQIKWAFPYVHVPNHL